jgi:hypothetical protein
VTPRVVECRSSGIVSTFKAGLEPRPRRGWQGNGTVCPACRRREISARLDSMTDTERRAAAREAILAAPTTAVNKISEQTGIVRSLILSEKRRLVAKGLAKWSSYANRLGAFASVERSRAVTYRRR